MRYIKSCILAFSYYTKIPMPQLRFEENDGESMFCFFPLIGLLIGIFEALWLLLAEKCGTGAILTAAGSVAIPVAVTGGIHLDGFLDTSDAVASWKSREERLAIMHDPHTGAFAVISCCVHLMLAFGAASEAAVRNPGCVWFVFSLSHVLTALLVVFEKPAGNSGMLYSCTRNAAVRRIAASSVFYFVLLTGIARWLQVLRLWLVFAVAGFFVLLVYRIWIRRTFGGITGDLAGCFLSVCELVLAITAAFCR
ncbi:MAG: adenosylcobinamide-GDP ribazoletransferase [Eubacterium sp.]|nr:adenosylcobinamide-GDP ribazoletransferase [Eubacterium sp.]